MAIAVKGSMLTFGSWQGLFDVLPQKLKERRDSLNSAPVISRKRPPPGGEPGPLQARQTMPNITTPISVKESSGTPSRTRTLPSGFLAKLAKRNSMPDPHALSTLSEGAAPAQTAQLLGYPSPAVASPGSGSFDFTPQLGNVQIPDLKSVMFPSDNPFAYPNQPISTLESADGTYSYPEHTMTPNDNSMFGTPSSSHVPLAPIPPSHLGFDFAFQQPQASTETNRGTVQGFAGNGAHFSAPLSDILMHNAIGTDDLHLGGMGGFSESMNISDMPGAGDGQHEECWNQGEKGAAGLRNGATHGVYPPLEGYFNTDNWTQWGEQHFTHQEQQ